jgi:hypothetical protein
MENLIILLVGLFVFIGALLIGEMLAKHFDWE